MTLPVSRFQALSLQKNASPSNNVSLLRGTPHSGYHWRGQTSRFFEGWYLRLTLPDVAQTFAFMYSIDDPAGGSRHSGGVAQILGPNEQYICRTFPDVGTFWAYPHQMEFGHCRKRIFNSRLGHQSGHWVGRRVGCLSSDEFRQVVIEGYQVSPEHHQGRLRNPAGEIQAEWDYIVTPIAGWGAQTQQATAGWLSYLPVFEPGWQVLMAHGLASGWVRWQGEEYRFVRSPAYAEKNWGGAFPSKWFWIQCNAFADAPGLSITAAGGVRDVLAWKENVGLIGIHYQGQFYEFLSMKTAFTWTVDPWGTWRLSAQNYRYRVQLTGIAKDKGARVRVPTLEGMQWQCRDTTHGRLHMQLWHLQDDLPIIDATSELAGLEVGGGPWEVPWVLA